MKASDFKHGDKVLYIPNHAGGHLSHPDVERGVVNSANDTYVFVKFNTAVARLGWHGTTSQACDPDTLRKEETP